MKETCPSCSEYVKIEVRPRPSVSKDMIYDERGETISYGNPKPRVQIVLPNEPTTPQEELERAQKLLNPYPENELTVGDLSFSKKQEQTSERVRQRLRNLGIPGVGDISVATDKKDREFIEKYLDQLYEGPVAPKPSMSESQAINAERIAKTQEKQDEVAKIKRLIFEAEQEKKLW